MGADKNLTTTELSQGDASTRAATGVGSNVGVSSVAIQQPSKYQPGKSGETGFGKLTVYLQPNGSNQTQALEPIMPADTAYRLYRLSPLLSTIIEAFTVNVYGVNYQFEPVIDLDDPDSRERVRSALEALKVGEDLDATADISDAEVDKEIERIRARMRREYEFLDAWFSNCCSEPSYHGSRILLGQDKGIMGQGYFEVVRDVSGKPRRLVWVPSFSIRALPVGADWVCVNRPGKVTSLHWHDEEPQWRHFRQYIQVDTAGKIVSRYKEFGDPRVLSRNSGKYYDSVEAMVAAEAKPELNPKTGKEDVIHYPLPATEILAFRHYYAGSQAYGLPRWSPNGPELVGLRDLAEHNRLVVTDQSVPNMVLMVAGAKVDDEVIEGIKEQLKDRDPSEPQILVLQAYDARNAPSGPTITPQMKLERTKEAQNNDALGLNYTKQGWKGIRQTHRMPKVAIGDDDGTNRATAYAMARFTEDQVYDPERCDYDDRVNTTLLPDLGIRYLRYKTLSRAPKDPELLAGMIERLSRAGVLSPDEGREISSQIFNRKFKSVDAVWTKLPTTILNAILQTKNKLTASAVLLDDDNDDDAGEGNLLQNLREAILQDFESEGMQLPNVQGRDNEDDGGGESSSD